MTAPQTFETERLVLRPLIIDDWVDLQRIAGNETVAPMLASVGNPWPEPEVKDWIARSAPLGKLGFRLGVCKKDRSLIGMVGLGGDPTSLMFFIDQPCWNAGFATEATEALLQACFAQNKLAEIVADCFIENSASQRVLEKLGFQKTGTSTASSRGHLEPAPVFLYRLQRAQFESAVKR